MTSFKKYKYVAQPVYQTIRSHTFNAYLVPKNIEFAIDYKPRETDRFLVTYPKCGTAWTQQIIHLILNDGHLSKNDVAFFDDYWLENVGPDLWPKHVARNRAKPRAPPPIIRTHLPRDLLPYNSAAKYLLVLRNPKDQFLSYYNMINKLCRNNLDFNEYFEQWMAGALPYGDYFQYVREYWSDLSNTAGANDSAFTLLFYEQMHRNLTDSVLKIGSFLGPEYEVRLRSNPRLMAAIVKQSGIKQMKTFHENDLHFSKGIVGGWRSRLTREQSNAVDSRVREVWAGTGLDRVWERELLWESTD